VYSVSMATYLESKADLSCNEFFSGCQEDWVSFLFALFISLHFTIQCLSVCVCVCVCVRVHVCVCACVMCMHVHAYMLTQCMDSIVLATQYIADMVNSMYVHTIMWRG